MYELLNSLSYFEFFLFIVGIVSLRYFGIAVPMYLVIWKWMPAWSEKMKIQLGGRRPIKPKIELMWSVSTILVNGLWGMAMLYFYKLGWFQVYTEISGVGGYLYYAASLMLGMIFHDAYFYWAHRAMHTKRLYKHVHEIHHKSINPTALAAYCFHPLEAFLEVAFLLPLLVLIPMHYSAVFLFLLITFLFNMGGHLGIDFTPKGTWDKWWGSWLTTPTHHNIHHQRFNCNYALYYRYWDEIFGTLYPGTGKVYNDIKNREPAAAKQPAKA